ncbi:MAG: hypothetical protein HY718_16070 [Planctomycetes bacterium]|nr:hypothetical protein [Planctomycetota bacterium]
MLMVGDAPGDLAAARTLQAKFFPINPGREEASWKRFLDEAIERFLTGEYTADYEARLIDDFLGCLPEHPPWRDSLGGDTEVGFSEPRAPATARHDPLACARGSEIPRRSRYAPRPGEGNSGPSCRPPGGMLG